jgi:CHAT domain/FHA domain/TIR domain
MTERVARLTLPDGNGRERVLELEEGTTVVGRAGDVGIPLATPGVSRHHAELSWDGTRLLLRDLGSTNGTTVNGQAVVDWYELSDGDMVRFGSTEARVEVPYGLVRRGRIFISYRRQETARAARQLYDVMVERFGAEQVFKDVDNIESGDDFLDRITSAVGSCDVLLALIGPRWLTITDDETGQRRLDNPEDYVRLEIRTALTRNVRVIPILIDDARMPPANELPADLAPLVRRQAVEISPITFNTERLMATVQDTLAAQHAPPSAESGAFRRDSAYDVRTTGPTTEEYDEAEPSPTRRRPRPEPAQPRRRRRASSWLHNLRERIDERRTTRSPSGSGRPTSSPSRQAYPLVKAPDVVVVDEPFNVMVGIATRRDRTLIGTGGFAVTGDTALDVMLTFDPASLRLDGESRFTLGITSDDPYPARVVQFTALDGDELIDERRIGVHYLRDGAVVGIAWRLIVAVPSAGDIARTRVPATRERELLDLSSVLIEDPPDLVLAVYRADTAAVGDYVWSAYPAAAEIMVPDHKRAENIGDPTAFPQSIGAEVARTGPGQGGALYDFLLGTGKRIGRKIPAAMQQAIRTVAERADRATAASVLLFTEDPYVPWELAVFQPPLRTDFGGDSPFLGAHVAIGRWPLTETRPRPIPRRSVEVEGRAVLTARYVGVTRWPQLPEAEEEAASIAAAYPGTVTIEPLYSKVMDCLRGDPGVDVLHVALHGQFDPAAIDQGLVLLAPRAGGEYVAQYLKPQHVESVTMLRPTFVFLNACQVGAGQRVLGDYAGLAAAFLSAGAAGVVAALWNVNDVVARGVAEQFYRALDADGEPVAEVLRQTRVRYTRQNAETEPDGRATTLVAYQFFGHPRLRLTTAPGGGHG